MILWLVYPDSAFSSDDNLRVYATYEGKVASECNSVAMVVDLSNIDGDVYFGGVSFLVPSAGYTTRGIMGKFFIEFIFGAYIFV